MGNITLDVPRFLRPLTEEAPTLTLKGATVGECLKDLFSRFPAARDLVLDREGKVLGHIDLYVNGTSTFPQELARPVRQGDTLSMLYLIDGG